MQCLHSSFFHPNFSLLRANRNNKKFTSNSSSKQSFTQQEQTHLQAGLNYLVEGIATGSSALARSNAKYISSTSNPFVKHCVKLRQSSSYRHFHGSVLVVGYTPIREICSFQQLLKGRTAGIEYLLLLDEDRVPEELNWLSAPIVRVNSSVMRKLSGIESSQSIEAIALMKFPTSFHNACHAKKKGGGQRWFPSMHRILVLDRIQDPGNLGTLLRSAVAFNWNAFIITKGGLMGGVFLLPGCCDPFNEKALRASRGAAFQLPIVMGNWDHLKELGEEFQMKIIAGHPDMGEGRKRVSYLSQTLVDSLADVPLFLVLGSEGRGLSEKSQLMCELFSIPMAGNFESLNVSVAGGIFMFMLQPTKERTF